MGKNNRVRRKRRLAQKVAREKRRGEKSANRGKGRILGPDLHVVPNPLEGVSEEQRRLAIQEIARKSEREYQEALAELRVILGRYDPLLVLSQMSCYGLSVAVDEAAGMTKLDSDYEILPYHVEILQALSLQIDPEDLSGNPCRPHVIAKVWNQVKRLCEAHNYRKVDPAGMDLSNEEKAVALAQELMRGATQVVRNWGYPHQIKRIARELYSPFDAKLLEVRGFSASDVFNVFQTMVTEVEARQTAHRNTLVELLRSAGTDRRLLVEEYYKLIGLDKEETELFAEYIELQETPLDVVRSMVIGHYDLRLPDVYTFVASSLAESLGLDKDRVNDILNEYALAWNALSDYETDHLHLSNPVWRNPLVILGGEEYFSALPAAFFSFVFPCMEAVLSPFAAEVSRRRAEYLESRVAQIVEQRFPGSDVKRNIKWVENGRTYETDLIAFIDSFALVIECKSGKVTPPALRGAPDRLRKHIEELLIDPNEQSLRLKRRLEFLGENPSAADPIRDEIGYDLGKVRKIVRVSVCLENLGSIQSSVKQLENTGWLPADFSPCPTMNLADFETVFDILEHPVQLLHYMMKREALESSVSYVGNELDLLGWYLTTLLDIGEFEPDVEINMVDMAGPLDVYYNSLDAGVKLEKPRPAILPLFASVFRQLEERGIERWTEMGVALNMFSPDDQTKITKMVVRLEKRVHKNWRMPGHENVLIWIPSTASNYALAYVMFKNGNAGQRREFMENAAERALAFQHVQRVIVIARNIDKGDAAYHTIALFGPSAGALW